MHKACQEINSPDIFFTPLLKPLLAANCETSAGCISGWRCLSVSQAHPAQQSRQPMLRASVCFPRKHLSSMQCIRASWEIFFTLLHASNNCLSPLPPTAHMHFKSCPIPLANFPQAHCAEQEVACCSMAPAPSHSQGDLSPFPAPTTSSGPGICPWWSSWPCRGQQRTSLYVQELRLTTHTQPRKHTQAYLMYKQWQKHPQLPIQCLSQCPERSIPSVPSSHEPLLIAPAASLANAQGIWSPSVAPTLLLITKLQPF